MAASVSAPALSPSRPSLWHRLWVGTSPEAAAAAEHALFSRHLTTPFTLSHVPIELPSLGLGTQFIRTLELNPDAPGPTIVWAHGAGAGIGWGYRTFDRLATLGGQPRRVLAFDWLGQALSSRPPFPTGKPRWLPPDAKQRIDDALRFFLLSLEAWRRAMQVESMHLFAHSTGAYVAAHYAMEHDDVVKYMVLHGAAGLGALPPPTDPDAADAERRPPAPPASLAPPAVLAALWEVGWLNFGVVARVGRLLREPLRQRFFAFIERRAGIVDEEELSTFFAYFYSVRLAATRLMRHELSGRHRHVSGPAGGATARMRAARRMASYGATLPLTLPPAPRSLCPYPPPCLFSRLRPASLTCSAPRDATGLPCVSRRAAVRQAICAGHLSSDQWVNCFLHFLPDADGRVTIVGRRPLAHEPPERLARLPPTAIIYGNHDWVSHTTATASAAAALPNCTLHIEDHGNHHLYFDDPARFIEIVEQDLKRRPKDKRRDGGWSLW